MAMFDDETPPPGYRWEYSGSGNTAVRYPVPDAPTGEGSDRPIAPHREVPGEVPDAVPTLDQMRLELSQQPAMPSLPDYLMNLPREIRDQFMALGEVGTSVLGSLVSPIAAAATGAGKNIYDYFAKGRVDPKATNEAANRAAQLFSYQPVMPSAQSILQTLGEAPAAIMGTGQGLPPVVSGINPRALQVPKGTTGALSAGVKRDISQFDNDVFNAQRGITPGYPTLGSEFSDAFVTPRPTVYDMLAGLEPSRIPSTASPAVKTKGGNFPTSFDNDLEVSGQIGRHLTRQLKNLDSPSLMLSNQFDNQAALQYQIFRRNEGMLHPLKNDESIQLIDKFINTHKEQFPELKTYAELEARRNAEKAFITGQYLRYLTNEMGTGAKTDTLVRLAEQGIAVPEIAQVFEANYPGRAADLEAPWALPSVKHSLTANKLKGIEAVQQTATTPFGKYIESLTDEGVTPTSKKLYEDLLTLQKKLGLPTKYADKPTPFERVPEDMPIWDLPELWSYTELGLDRVLQKLNTDLKSGAIKPENVKNVSIESLVRGLMDENLKKLEAERKLLLENLKATPRFNVPEPTQLSFVKSPGMTWIDIPETTDAKGLKLCTTLGKQAGWCTQDALTAKTYGSGDNRLTTLVDAEGRPHAQAKISEVPYPPKWDEAKPYLDAAKKQAETLPNGYTDDDVSNIAVQMAKNARPKNITELKPPENSFTSERSKTYSRRDPEYKAKITDSVLKFLNAGDWGNVKDLDLYDILDTRNSSDLNAYAKRAKLSGDKAVLNKFEAAELLGRTRPGRFATDKEITEFIKGPETLLYNHGSPTGGMTKLRTDIDRTRAAGTGLWLAEPFETAGTYAGMKGSIYGVEVKNEGLDVLDARNSKGGNIPLDAVIYHADGNKTTLKELADYLGVSTLSTDDVAKYSKSEGAKGLHILNVADISGRANPFVNTAPDYANNLVVFDPAIVKIIKEDKAPPFVPAGKAEGGAVRMADGGAVTDTLDKMVKSPQASNLLNLDLPNLIAAKQQMRPMKRGGKVQFSNNIDDMRYALTRFAQG